MRYLILVLSLAIALDCQPAQTQTETTFTLADQFGTETSWPPPEKLPMVLVYSDREGSRHSGPWLEAVRAHDHCVTLVEAANLGTAPLVARPFIRRAFRDNPPVLLDWKAHLANQYGFDEDKTNAYLLDEQGEVLYRTSGNGKNHSLEAFSSRLEAYCTETDDGETE